MVKCVGCDQELPVFPGKNCAGCGEPVANSKQVEASPSGKRSIDDLDRDLAKEGKVVMVRALWITLVFLGFGLIFQIFTFLLDPFSMASGLVTTVVHFLVTMLLFYLVFQGFKGAAVILRVYFVLGALVNLGMIIRLHMINADGIAMDLIISLGVILFVYLLVLFSKPSVAEFIDYQHQVWLHRR